MKNLQIIKNKIVLKEWRTLENGEQHFHMVVKPIHKIEKEEKTINGRNTNRT